MGLLEACFVGSVLLAMLTLLFVGWKSPEIVVRGLNACWTTSKKHPLAHNLPGTLRCLGRQPHHMTTNHHRPASDIRELTLQ